MGCEGHGWELAGSALCPKRSLFLDEEGQRGDERRGRTGQMEGGSLGRVSTITAKLAALPEAASEKR